MHPAVKIAYDVGVGAALGEYGVSKQARLRDHSVAGLMGAVSGAAGGIDYTEHSGDDDNKWRNALLGAGAGALAFSGGSKLHADYLAKPYLDTVRKLDDNLLDAVEEHLKRQKIETDFKRFEDLL